MDSLLDFNYSFVSRKDYVMVDKGTFFKMGCNYIKKTCYIAQNEHVLFTHNYSLLRVAGSKRASLSMNKLSL